MTSTGPTHLSRLLLDAARRVRNDGRFEVQPVLDGAPFRSVDVGPLADLLTAAASAVQAYEDRGWNDAKILDRQTETVKIAVDLARAIVGPRPRP